METIEIMETIGKYSFFFSVDTMENIRIFRYMETIGNNGNNRNNGNNGNNGNNSLFSV